VHSFSQPLLRLRKLNLLDSIYRRRRPKLLLLLLLLLLRRRRHRLPIVLRYR
jgi:hypothetical protein